MKKFIFAVAALVMTSLASCSAGSESTGKSDSDSTGKAQEPKNIQVLEDINAGEKPEPLSVAEEAAATEQSGIATMDDRAAVAVLADDNAIRPDKKVNRPMILDFNATWCVPCKKFAPVFEEAASVYGNQVDFYSVDIDRNTETAVAFDIEAVPTVVIITPDGKVQRFVGTEDILPAEKFEALIKAIL